MTIFISTVLPPISNVIIFEPNGTFIPKLAAVGSSTRAISSTDISSQRLTNHSLYPLYVSMGAVKTSLLISYLCGMFAHKIWKNFSPHSLGFKIFFWLIFSIEFPINLLKFEWKNKSEFELSLIFRALIPIFVIFEGSSNQTAEGITPGDEVIFGISTKTEFISFWSWKATTVLVFPKSIASVPDKLSSIWNYLNQLSSFCNLCFEMVE